MDGIALGIFSSRLDAVCEEMGTVLRKAAFSPNIRDRLDYSCAIFDVQGLLCAQAAHIPVHLGSMAWAMADIVRQQAWQEGDQLIMNDPFMGGTHLPDVTLVAPLYHEQQLVGFVVNRAHHADIGADSPGSMPISTTLAEEGRVIAPTLLYSGGILNEALFADLTENSRCPADAAGDIRAQISANRAGGERLQSLLGKMGAADYLLALHSLNEYAAKLALATLRDIPSGDYAFTDWMDDDGQGHQRLRIQVCLRIADGAVEADFSGTQAQVGGNINCPLSVTAAAVWYVFRCLMPPQTPSCMGAFRAIKITAVAGSLVNAQHPAAVVAGNVETSSRITDVVLGALAQAIPERIPAASQGSMNNIAMGQDSAGNRWDYYETIGGGMGAGKQGGGLSAVQTHMTNTLNTPVEVLESRYPVRVESLAIRRGSGGAGQRKGGDGMIRRYRFLADAQVTLLTERRSIAPWGLQGGQPGAMGRNLLNDQLLPAKCSLQVKAGDLLSIETPGGGGFGMLEK
ncbi:MAG: hydantoinase B/oxoprolinase family protein [gamma proteobacterium symbiont of Bathyaustriella thionipta]|nr:hydantoinase B/oxoprolinase family protein [gamma proteobacterium symbiont of Bathyaustriella thionipta]